MVAGYVFVQPPTGWRDATESTRLPIPDAGASDWFGLPVALDDHPFALGSSVTVGGNVAQGAAYVDGADTAGAQADTG